MEEQMQALAQIIKLLEPFDKETQTRIIATVRLMLNVSHVKHIVDPLS